MTPEQLDNRVNKVLDDRQKFNAFNPSLIPYHTHNGADSPPVEIDTRLDIAFYDEDSILSEAPVAFISTNISIITITLPDARTIAGKVYYLKDWSGGAGLFDITIATTSGQTIDGMPSDIINTNYGSRTVISDGTNWYIIAST